MRESSVESSLTSAVRGIIQILFYSLLLTACTRPASSPPVILVTENVPTITIDSVRVDQGEGIFITGRSSMPEGKCLKTELLINRQSAGWWPRDVCIEMDETGQWELLVALGRNGAPAQMQPGLEYELHAWWPEKPDLVTTRFPFSPLEPTPLP
jgi:hypothetical protein